ncbi:PTS sugar transporter subunit IIB [Zophobihabitans entericus]|uniref:PTS sugar transporter subunit IIB n=1 Tax=Zophobihabitans entericus TaxID=1635327 RepID=A0A6G9I8C5_9GAMM|nr:PTS sugar transporter subunit IIB [Zophobihabitans entericus]QIQ20461.1 PTS sugar transporter subunit IIB [Zophobihabitans entericus]
MKKIIVACGSGVATSQTVASKVSRLLQEKGHNNIKVEVIDLKSLDTHIKDSAAYIAITKVDKEYPIPVINGISFLTGMGMDAELQKIIDACK